MGVDAPIGRGACLTARCSAESCIVLSPQVVPTRIEAAPVQLVGLAAPAHNAAPLTDRSFTAAIEGAVHFDRRSSHGRNKQKLDDEKR